MHSLRADELTKNWRRLHEPRDGYSRHVGVNQIHTGNAPVIERRSPSNRLFGSRKDRLQLACRPHNCQTASMAFATWRADIDAIAVSLSLSFWDFRCG